MKKWLALYCVYDPDNYFGHRVKHLEAESIEDAEQQMHQFLEGMTGKGRWEYSIHERVPGSIEYRIYNSSIGKGE